MAGLLNNAATGDTYSAALTAVFPFPRTAFNIQVNNAAVNYQIGVTSLDGRSIDWEIGEHFLTPSAAAFRDPDREGFPPGTKYAAVRLRSAATGIPARVTVI